MTWDKTVLNIKGRMYFLYEDEKCYSNLIISDSFTLFNEGNLNSGNNFRGPEEAVHKNRDYL